jgi:hypothetical protein
MSPNSNDEGGTIKNRVHEYLGKRKLKEELPPKKYRSCPHGSQFCHGGQTTMYAWGKHAAPMHIPEGVGFRVGGGSNSRWGVLQVHALLPTKCMVEPLYVYYGNKCRNVFRSAR